MREGIDCKGRKWVERELKGTAKDITGQTYESLTAILPIYYENKTGWLCKCKCGNEVITVISQWGHVKSCGCISIKPKTVQRISSKVDLTGQTFGYWTVLGKNEEDHRYNKTHWWCQCKCGNKASIATGSLIGGHTHSCGCYQKERMTEIKKADLLGQRFGFITVIDSAPSRAGGQAYWKCQCDCGTIWEVAANNLLSGKTQSCGCILSLGEQYISQILKENHIHFRTQQTFSDLVSDTNTALRYDFAILDEEERPIRLIEFDGPQHQQSSEYFGGEGAFHRLQKHDALKNQYAFDHNIPLVRIPYKERNNITLDLLLGDKYLLTKT